MKLSSDNVGKQFNMKDWNSKREIWAVVFMLRTSILILSSPNCREEIQIQVCSTTKFMKLFHCYVLKSRSNMLLL